jgi:hypothetical protein
MKNIPWECEKKGLGIAACISSSYYRSRGVLKCMIGMKVKWSIRGQREERTQLLERNGTKMEIIYCKHMDNQPGMFFIFCTTNRWWGTLEVLRAAERGKSVDLCAAIIHSVSLCAFLFFINIEI